MTHFHGDHISGLMAKDTNAPNFPNAEILVPAGEYKFWTDPSTTAGAAKRIQAVFPGWKNINQFEGDKEVVPGVRAIASNGHTPGHTSYPARLRPQAADRAGRRHQHPRAIREESRLARWCSTSTRRLAEANRRKMFDRVVADKITVTGYHFGLPGAGTIKKDGKGYAFLPVKA